MIRNVEASPPPPSSFPGTGESLKIESKIDHDYIRKPP
jgi:hypothetical protein